MLRITSWQFRMSIRLDNFPTFTENHFRTWQSDLTPIEYHHGYKVKRDDYFNLGEVSGGKVRQCSKLVYDNLDHIRENCNGGILTAAGIPSPQSAITSAVAKYFGLKCLVTVPYYPGHIKDSYRVNVSLAQKFGAKVYGVGNPNISGPEMDAKRLVEETGYFQIKVGMNGRNVIGTVSNQVNNVPDNVETIVVIAGSGLSALGVAVGCKLFNNNVKNIYAVALSDYINKNKKMWYDKFLPEEQFDGKLNIVPSEYPYQHKLKLDYTLPLDQTYEAKAWDWMIKNIEPSEKVLFWDVGIKEYDLSYIEPIKWHKSEYEKILDREMRRKTETVKHGFF